MSDQTGKGKGKASADASAGGSADPVAAARTASSADRPARQDQRTNDPAQSAGGASSASLANSLVASMRSTMAGNQIGSLLASASGGKGEFAAYRGSQQGGGMSQQDLKAAMISDLRSGAQYGSDVASNSSFRSASRSADGVSASQAALGSEQFDAFASARPPDQAQNANAQTFGDRLRDMGRYAPESIGPYSSSADLDEALYAQVRAMESLNIEGQSNHLNGAWTEAEASARSLTDQQRSFASDPEWNRRWASGLGGAEFMPLQGQGPEGRAADTSQSSEARYTVESADFMSLLANEEAKEAAEGPSATEYARPVWDKTSADDLVGLPEQWRPPSPSLPAHLCVTREQLEMHRALSAAQTDPEHALRQGEGIAPRPDDQEAREGVYAPTAEDALRSIWDGRGRAVERTAPDDAAEEAQTSDGGEWSAQRGRKVVRKIIDYLPKSSYVDDVFGLPPTLAETMRRALVQDPPEDTATVTEDSRKKAIQRLEALWGHLSNTRPAVPVATPAQPPPLPPPRSAGVAAWMEDWLKSQPQ